MGRLSWVIQVEWSLNVITAERQQAAWKSIGHAAGFEGGGSGRKPRV